MNSATRFDHHEWNGILREIRRILPLQNPLDTFVHNNMLMAWESFPFWEGVNKAAELYQATPIRDINPFWQKFKVGEIFPWALEQSLADEVRGDDAWLGAPCEVPPEIKWLAQVLTMAPYAPRVTLSHNPEPSQGWASIQVRAQFTGSSHADHRLFDGPTTDWICHLLEGALDQGIAHWHHPAQSTGLLAFFYDWLKYTKVYAFPWQKVVAREIGSRRQDARTIIMEAWRQSGLDSLS